MKGHVLHRFLSQRKASGTEGVGSLRCLALASIGPIRVVRHVGNGSMIYDEKKMLLGIVVKNEKC